ncbi:Hsp20/alpha crystallin family protein [Candidatus Bathyarchaeota archaeon]|nr:Hsp20/alpha crystallin family protein [Candidatus Bathyarchaeota archaeon]
MSEEFKRRRGNLPWRDDFEGPFSYKPGGFYFGIKGKTPIHEFKGNYFKMSVKRFSEFEPLTDVIEKEYEIIVVTELQGVKKEELEVKVQEKTLIIISRKEKIQHYKALDLPKPVNPKPLSLTLKNGVLIIELKKTRENLIELNTKS